MMFKAVVCILGLVALQAAAQGPIDGVYYADQGACRIYAQIHLMNFLTYVGPCDGSTGAVIMGSYVIAPTSVSATAGVLSVTYSTILPGGGGGPQPGNTYSFTWEFLDAARTTLNITSDAALDYYNVIYHRNTASAIDGTWLFRDAQNNAYQLEAQGNTYLSYTTQNNRAASTTMGTFELTNPNKIDVYFSYGPAGFAGTKENGTYAVTSTSLNVVVTVEAAEGATVSLGPYAKVGNDAQMEGVWSGFTTNDEDGYCVTVVEFHANLWRGYQTRCDPTYNFGYGTFLGTFNHFSANAVNLTYNFVDFHELVNPPDLVGETFTFTATFGMSGSNPTLALVRTVGNSVTRVQLTKIDTMPTQTNVDIRLQGNIGDFTLQAQADFVDNLATILGIDARNIRITGIRSGSIIVTVEISDDLFADKSSTTAPAVLANTMAIGTFPVLGVTNITPTAGNGDQNTVAQLAACWMLVLALIALALF